MWLERECVKKLGTGTMLLTSLLIGPTHLSTKEGDFLVRFFLCLYVWHTRVSFMHFSFVFLILLMGDLLWTWAFGVGAI